MFLFESGASYRSDWIGLRDTIARFTHDLATRGIPMSLASVKAAADAVSRTRRAKQAAEPRLGIDTESLQPVLPIGPLVGLP